MPPAPSFESIVPTTIQEVAPIRALDTDYWLGHCQGFRVDSPEGKVGRVEDVLFKTSLERPDTLLIRSGLLGAHLVAVPVDEVDEVAPRRGQVALRHRPGERRRRNGRSHLRPS